MRINVLTAFKLLIWHDLIVVDWVTGDVLLDIVKISGKNVISTT